jgi:peptidoglycan/LPS O-acetylase OafA/YrhL
MAFYAFLPLYAVVLRRLRGGLRTELAGAALLFAIGLAYKLWVFSMGPVSDVSLLRWHLALPEYIDYFAVGIALAALSAAYEGSSLRPAGVAFLVRRPWVTWLGAAALFLVVSRGIGLGHGVHDDVTEARYLLRHYLYAAIALCLVLPALSGDPREGWIRRLLAWRPLLWVGLVSYGAFLYHFAVLEQLNRWDFGSFANDVTPYLWFPVALAGTLAIATVSWYAYERPLLTLRRLVPGRTRGAAGPVEGDRGAVVERAG